MRPLRSASLRSSGEFVSEAIRQLPFSGFFLKGEGEEAVAIVFLCDDPFAVFEEVDKGKVTRIF